MAGDRARRTGRSTRVSCATDPRSAARPQNSRKFACMRTRGIRTEAPKRPPRWPPAFGDAIAPNKHVRRCSRSGQSSEPPARRARNQARMTRVRGGSAIHRLNASTASGRRDGVVPIRSGQEKRPIQKDRPVIESETLSLKAPQHLAWWQHTAHRSLRRPTSVWPHRRADRLAPNWRRHASRRCP